MSHPKVLFITPCAFNHVTGGGITFTNLFSGWPKDSIATVHNDAVPVSDDVCSRYYRLGPKEIIPYFPFNLRRAKAPDATDGWVAGEGSTSASGFKTLLKKAYRKIIGDAGIPDRGILTPQLRDWIREFRPDVIHTILGSLAYIDLVRAVKLEFQVPLVIHLMDDGVTDPLRKGLFARHIRRSYGRKFADLLPLTQARMGICKKMCVAYANRYGHGFVPFQNTVDLAKWSRYVKRDLGIKGIPQVVYMGSIFSYAQLQSIIDFCEVVKSLHAEGTGIRFDLYTPLRLYSGEVQGLADSKSVFLHDTITNDEEYFRVLGAADVLLLPVNFDPLSIHFIRFSMPTKVPSYLGSGTPILVYGPPEVAQVEYALEDSWGKVVDRRDPALLRQGLLDIIQDAGLRQGLSSAARAMALENHDSAKIRADFQGELTAAVGRRAAVAAG